MAHLKVFIAGFAVAGLMTALSPAAAVAADASPPNVVVNVDQRGDLIVVDVTATVAAPVGVVWGVLTDYAHMASFLSSLKTSAVVSGQGNTVNVEQTVKAS